MPNILKSVRLWQCFIRKIKSKGFRYYMTHKIGIFFTHPSIKKIYTNKSAKMEAMWAFGNRYHPQVRKISALQIYSH